MSVNEEDHETELYEQDGNISIFPSRSFNSLYIYLFFALMPKFRNSLFPFLHRI